MLVSVLAAAALIGSMYSHTGKSMGYGCVGIVGILVTTFLKREESEGGETA